MRYLVDTSVLARARQAVAGDRLTALARAGQLWTCQLIDLEVVYASRARDVAEVIEERRALPAAPITADVMHRALQVARSMAVSGLHRGAKPVDLVIAAAAEASGLAVLHYDDDYDRIACHWPTSGVDRSRRNSRSLTLADLDALREAMNRFEVLEDRGLALSGVPGGCFAAREPGTG